jgi:hypothetical protein
MRRTYSPCIQSNLLTVPKAGALVVVCFVVGCHDLAVVPLHGNVLVDTLVVRHQAHLVRSKFGPLHFAELADDEVRYHMTAYAALGPRCPGRLHAC